MEPTDLNSPRPADPQLETWLRAQRDTSPLPDNGFTAGVMAALPPVVDYATLRAARHQASRRRIWLCCLGALTGVVAARLSQQAGLTEEAGGEVTAVFQQLAAGAEQFQAPSLLLGMTVAIGAVLWIYLPPARLWRRLNA